MGTKPGGSLASTEGFGAARQDLFVDGAVVFGYVQFRGIFEALLKGISYEAPQVHDAIAMIYERMLKPIKSIAFSSGWTEEGTFTSGRVELIENPGDLYVAGAADLGLIEYIPGDANSFAIGDVPASAWGQFAMDCIDAGGAIEIQDGFLAQDMLQSESAELHAWLFGDKRAELEAAMAGIGSRTFNYTVPQGMAAEQVSVLELTDPAAFSSMLEQLMPRLREVLVQSGAPIGLEMKYVRHRVKQEDGTMVNEAGPAYYMLDIEGATGLPPEAAVILGSLQPTIGVTDDGWFVFSMSKQRVRRLLLNGLEKPDNNILSNPEAAAFLSGLQGDVIGIGWSDPRPMVKAIAGMAVGMAPMAFNMVPPEVDLPVDAENVPSADLFTRYLRTSETVALAKGNLRTTDSIGSFGLADVFTVLGTSTALGPPLAQYFIMMTSGGMAPSPVMVEPTEEPEEF
jgi:hypothetical protein